MQDVITRVEQNQGGDIKEWIKISVKAIDGSKTEKNSELEKDEDRH